jgi:hypothetical protein
MLQLVFAAFDGEAWGYLGSRKFLQELEEGADSVNGINSSMIEQVSPRLDCTSKLHLHYDIWFHMGGSFPRDTLFTLHAMGLLHILSMGDYEFSFDLFELLYDLGLSVLYLSVITQPQSVMLNFCNKLFEHNQVLEIGSVGKGISQGHPLFYAHSARVTILSITACRN